MAFRQDNLDRSALITTLARAIGAFSSGDDDEGRTIVRDLAKSLDDGGQQTLPGIQGPPPSLTAEMVKRAAVGRLFAYWQEKCDHRAAKLTPDRARVIIGRLKEGYTEAEVRKAIEGASVAAYVNDDGKKFDDLTLICRSGSKLEDFIDRGVRAFGDVVVELGESSPIEDQIAELRRKMSELKKAGRGSEYEQAAASLAALMERRKERRTA
jgi:hypothetical protein